MTLKNLMSKNVRVFFNTPREYLRTNISLLNNIQKIFPVLEQLDNLTISSIFLNSGLSSQTTMFALFVSSMSCVKQTN